MLDTLASLCRAVGTDHCKAILLQALEFSLNLYSEIDEPEFRSAMYPKKHMKIKKNDYDFFYLDLHLVVQLVAY